MFQQTIQDVLALTESSGRAEDLLACARTRIGECERFEAAVVVVRVASVVRTFTIAPGLADIGTWALGELGEEMTLRLDTTTDLQARGFPGETAITSLLILRVASSDTAGAALVLGHSRAWSFAGAPLSRLRTIGQVVLRLLVAPKSGSSPDDEALKLRNEVTRLRAHVATLENEVIALRADRKKS